MSWRDRIRERLESIDQQGLYRRRLTVEGPHGADVVCDGRRLINFCSNDYLGLANHPDVVAALQRGAGEYGLGSGASHLVCGHGRSHHALEEELAVFLGRDRVLLFSTGYMANLGVISALTARNDTVLEDRLNHASLLDGAKLAGAHLRRYRHADTDDLQALLANESGQGLRLVASDGVFSMDGDRAPVATLAATVRRHSAMLMVDDAHGLGVLGEKGGGVLQVQGQTQDDVPVLVGTLGKAFGTFGAFVGGSEELIEYLIQRARTYIYTTAMPAAVAEATRAALIRVREDDWRRQHLTTLITRFRSGVSQLGLELMVSSTPIQPVLVGSNQAASRASTFLREAGFMVTAIRPPTVPAGSARLRITLTSAHSETQVDRLLDALSDLRAAVA